MMKCLIVKCVPLNDQWECDADRIPMFITDDWKRDAPDYTFEVWEIKENYTLELIRDYE